MNIIEQKIRYGKVRKPYTQTLTNADTTGEWVMEVTNLPEGLIWDGTQISGKPVNTGNHTFTTIFTNTIDPNVGPYQYDHVLTVYGQAYNFDAISTPFIHTDTVSEVIGFIKQHFETQGVVVGSKIPKDVETVNSAGIYVTVKSGNTGIANYPLQIHFVHVTVGCESSYEATRVALQIEALLTDPTYWLEIDGGKNFAGCYTNVPPFDSDGWENIDCNTVTATYEILKRPTNM